MLEITSSPLFFPVIRLQCIVFEHHTVYITEDPWVLVGGLYDADSLVKSSQLTGAPPFPSKQHEV
jgi:hypothetical protein